MEIAARSVGHLFSLSFVYLQYFFFRFGIKSVIWLLIAPVPVHCFSITLKAYPRCTRFGSCQDFYRECNIIFWGGVLMLPALKKVGIKLLLLVCACIHLCIRLPFRPYVRLCKLCPSNLMYGFLIKRADFFVSSIISVCEIMPFIILFKILYFNA